MRRRLESINLPQLVTRTDRLLAFGLRRRLPLTAIEAGEPDQHYEITERMARQ
jgi:hypothetical protein